MNALRFWIFLIAVVSLPIVSSANAQNAKVIGDWRGTLKTGTTKLDLILHVNADSVGKLTATLDSVTQNSPNMPVDPIHFNGSHLEFSIPLIGAFSGEMNSGGSKISGAWTEGGSSDPLTFRKLETAAKPFPDLNGTWEGLLVEQSARTRITLRIDTVCCAQIAVAIDLDDQVQLVNAAPSHDVIIKDGQVSFKSHRLDASFKGSVSPSGTEISGAWKQHGKSTPLKFMKVEVPQSP